MFISSHDYTPLLSPLTLPYPYFFPQFSIYQQHCCNLFRGGIGPWMGGRKKLIPQETHYQPQPMYLVYLVLLRRPIRSALQLLPKFLRKNKQNQWNLDTSSNRMMHRQEQQEPLALCNKSSKVTSLEIASIKIFLFL